MDDATLVAQWRAGDAGALRALVDRHYQTVYRVARLLTGRHADAEDVCQETWLRVCDKGGQLRNPARFRSWLIGIAVNQARTQVRRRRPAGALPDDVPEVGRDGPAQIAEDRDSMAHLGRALDGLEWFSKTVIVMHVMAEVPGPEVARLLGCSSATVYREIESAMARLRYATRMCRLPS